MTRRRFRFPRRAATAGAVVILVAGLSLALATVLSLRPVAPSLRLVAADAQRLQVTDRNGTPLEFSYQGRWNSHDPVALHDVPALLKDALLFSEDRRFFQHKGVDWRGRAGAAWQNLRRGRTVRGASTITEQVVRMVNPRPRTLWSKWLEGFEAAALERAAGKAEILEFYINQIPYAANRRGVTQAARYYFNRDLDTLNGREIMALVVMARAPSAYDLYRYPARVTGGIERLAAAMAESSLIDARRRDVILAAELRPERPGTGVDARHFARHVRLSSPAAAASSGRIRTTLDSTLQAQVQDILNRRVAALSRRNVHNGAAIVADHATGEILAWAVAGAGAPEMETPGADIDAVLAPRQPGSSMKPFLYALALEKGWTAATLIDDTPLAEAIGNGLHRFRNYSNTYYGPVTLREALGNSLNIPALRTIRHVGSGAYLTRLQSLGFESLDRASYIYDDGLALGTGEVSLLELAQAYAALANRGIFRPLKTLPGPDFEGESRRVFSPETASLIGNILSDPLARQKEFGRGSVLNLPLQTAVKTGTSTDYRDAWAVGYNDRYVVGLWMGNLDNAPMYNVTGSSGPALAARAIFDRLNRGRVTSRLYVSPLLSARESCAATGGGDNSRPCLTRTEWFASGTGPVVQASSAASPVPRLARPTDGLQMAIDPRIPRDRQKFRFEVSGVEPAQPVLWIVDGAAVATTREPYYLWPLEKGLHTLSVMVGDPDGEPALIPEIRFLVK